MKFLTDRSLGRLTKWLRLLGYDTESYPGDADRSFLNRARSEGRVALTRKRSLGKKQFMGEMLILEADLVEDQLRYVISHFRWNRNNRRGMPSAGVSSAMSDSFMSTRKTSRNGYRSTPSKPSAVHDLSPVRLRLLARNPQGTGGGFHQEAHSDESPLIFSTACFSAGRTKERFSLAPWDCPAD